MKIVRDVYSLLMLARMNYDAKIVNAAYKTMKEPIDKNSVPMKIKRVCFILDNMLAHSGGHTSILRLGTEIFKMGYNVNFVLLNNQDINQAKKIAYCNLKEYKGEFVKENLFESEDSDIIVATASNTVFSAVEMKGYKVYFVQDYEPTFFPLGDRYLMAKKTYELGFHIISLGKWNVKMIEKECENVRRIDWITFPCESTEYPYKKRDYSKIKDKRTIVIAAYVKFVGRRLPLVTQELLYDIKKKFKCEGKDVKIIYFGENKSLRCRGGINKGKLTKKELRDLYYNVDFGYVSSYSNVSLVPYEMLSTGLPVIEIKEGSFNDFFPDGCGILTSISGDDLYSKLNYYIINNHKLDEMIEKSLSYIKELSWKKSAEEFMNAILKYNE